MTNIQHFVFLSAGPVGDHLVEVDMANYFFEETGVPSIIVSKHPSAFLRDLSLAYRDHIKELPFVGFGGRMKLFALLLRSIFVRNIFVFIFPIPLPNYLKLFVFFIRYCTRSRAVGFQLEGTKSFPVGGGYVNTLGLGNVIPFLAEPFTKSAERMLQFLGYAPRSHVPQLKFSEKPEIFAKLGVVKGEYVTMHITPSHVLRTLPADRWNGIIRTLLEKLPDTRFVFTGAGVDGIFIETALTGIPRDRIIIAVNKTDARELLSLYKNARVNVTVQTGNGLMINMLHVPTVVVDIKGTAMFYYDFNEQAKILYSTKGCTCNSFETQCTMIPYGGEEYMACVFNINDADVIDVVVLKYLGKRA